MSDYIIHNIIFNIENLIVFDGMQDPDKPALKYPNYYLGKAIGGRGHVLPLQRIRRGKGEEPVPNCVLMNEDGIALIRIHNKENFTLYDLPESSNDEVLDCVAVPQSSYPYAYVVVDYRDGRCQIAIEKTPNWGSKTDTIRTCLQDFFNQDKKLLDLGIKVASIKEKTIATKFEDFIDGRIVDNGDVIESFTFEYPNLKRHPVARIPENLAEQMEYLSKNLEYFGGISAETTTKMGQDVDCEKLKQLSMVVSMCSDNAFDLSVKFRDYGDYKCDESIVAKYEMNEIVITNFKDSITPETIDSDHDLKSWLDYVFDDIAKIEEGCGYAIPTKPKK